MDLITISISIDENLLTEFKDFFNKRSMSFDNGLNYVLKDFLVRHRIKNLNDMMDKYRLSPREKEVALLTCKGLPTKEIACKLFISYDTSHNHLRNIYRKCGVQNKIELVNLLNHLKYD